ncbi:MAG: hypothetical protein RIA69_02830 [Cyclobacteriaceae bacterium]
MNFVIYLSLFLTINFNQDLITFDDSRFKQLVGLNKSEIVYLLQITNLVRNEDVLVDQFYFSTELPEVYFNTLGCKPGSMVKHLS